MPRLSVILTCVWLVLSAAAHLHGALPFLRADTLSDKNSTNAFVGAYREWCKTDRRYCSQDSCVQAFQGLTAMYGVPGCVMLIVGIAKNAWWRHLLQLVLCVLQGYGTLIYFVSAYFPIGGKGPVFPMITKDAKDFFGLFFGLNFLWILIPGILAVQSIRVLRDVILDMRKRIRQ